MNHTHTFALAALLGFAPLVASAPVPVPKAGPPRVLIASHFDRDAGYQLYLVDPGGGAARRAGESKVRDTEPAWSPDGKTVAFASDREQRPAIWTMTADGTEPQRLVSDLGSCGDLRWSPDGTRLAFTSGQGGGSAVYVTEVATGKTTMVSDVKTRGYTPEWSPDGKRIAYTFRATFTYAVAVMDADGANRRTVSGEDGGTNPVWLPHGRQLLYAATDGTLDGYNLHLIDADGTNSKRLIGGALADARWSPDGRRVVYCARVRERADGGSVTRYQVTTADADGRARRVVVESKYPCTHLRWSPDGLSLSYVRKESEYPGVLVVCDADGANSKDVLKSVRAAEWKPK